MNKPTKLLYFDTWMVIYQFYNMSSLELEKSEFKSFPLPIFAVSESPKRAPLYVEIDIEDMLF